MKPTRYKDYRLTAVSTPEFGGRYQSRVALTVIRLGRPLSQRFVDFKVFPTQVEADDYAIEGGKRWIDDQTRAASTAFQAEYDTLV